MDIAQILADHTLWLAGKGGARAKLTGSTLWRVNFTRADLTRADLRGADLRGANLTGADLRGADLAGARLTRIKGAVVLACDSRHVALAIRHADGWMIAGGCGWFTVAEALAHWGAIDYPDRARGDAYCAAIRALPGIKP